MSDDVLAQALVYLVAAVVFVPLSKRLGLGAVLGYLIAGVTIGPWVFGFVGGEGHNVMHFAEFGVVMMLFIVGLELRPSLLWQLRRPIFGLGGMQVAVTAAAGAGVALACGIAWKPAVAIGMILAMSSTAIVLASLTERNMLKTNGGQSAFSVLLFQDISVIPILAVFPVLGVVAGNTITDVTKEAGRPGWLSAIFVIGAVGLVVVIGRFLVRPLFRFLAGAQLREAFTAAALLIVVGIAYLMGRVGLSPALGTFLAGVVLADSEYRHELETDVEPFKGLLLGLFFISVGAQINFGLIANEPAKVIGVVLATMIGKLAILHVLARMFGLDRPARWLLAFSLAQIGEFAFVLLSFAVQERIFDQDLSNLLTACVAISMVLTPPLFILLERFVLPLVTDDEADKRPQDQIVDADTPVVIAGYGRFGQMVGRILRANGIPLTILDLDPEMVDVVGRLGIKVYYGDASRIDLLHAAGCANARLFVVAVDDKDQATTIARTVREQFPKLQILARCRDRPHYWELRSLGVQRVFRETFGSAYETGIAALQVMGYRAHTALRLARKWRDHEEALLEDLGELWGSGDRDSYFARTRNGMEEAERLMRQEDPKVFVARDAGWDNESLRADPEPTEAATETGS
ncbi:MAG: monovalent cation:proton antiporter-2 (CPA2) family protein [Kofleriaceae bacterium]